jgi:capsular exopolysaccharide synthesis family protein
MNAAPEINTTYLDNLRRDLQSPESTKGITIEPDRRSRLVFLTDPAGLAVEQYKLLRRRLNALRPQGGVLAITSPGPGEGKTLTSVNLAWCFANGGQKTCLADLDFRSPGVAFTLKYSVENGGVEDILAGKSTIHELLCRVEGDPFYVLCIQERHAELDDLLSPAVLAPRLAELRSMFHWVILDLPPAIPMADVAEVVPQVDGAILVIRNAVTKKTMITPACDVLGSKLLGIVYNDSPIVGSAYYGSYGTTGHRK